MAKKCYVVYIGAVPGVYDEWKHCHNQVNGFPGNLYQGYESRAVAEAMWRQHRREKNRVRNFVIVITITLLLVVGGILYLAY